MFQIAYHCSGTEFAEEYFIMSGRRSVALLLLLLPASLPAYSLWKTIKTDAFNVFYPKGMEREAEEILPVRPTAASCCSAPHLRRAVY